MTGLRVDRREVYRYMGCREEPDSQLKDLVESCLEELETAAVPRQVSRRVKLALLEGNRLRLGELEAASQSLHRHLEGCTEAVLFAATLGTGVDLLLRRCAVAEMGRAVVMQAAAAAMVEAFCDRCQLELARESALFLRPRFSPGYGDLPLSFQKPLLAYLESDRRIGLSVTDSMMMVPTKSVSAVIGLTPEEQGCQTDKCAACPNLDCPFRRAQA